MEYSECKRMTVFALGIDSKNKVEFARNGNR